MNAKNDKSNSDAASRSDEEIRHEEDILAEQEGASVEKVQLSKSEHEQLVAKLDELEGLREKFLHSAADFENAKKRLARERDEFLKFGQENMIREFLPVLDNFQRALDHSAQSEDDNLKGIVDGILMVYKQVEGILKQQGLVKVETVGKPFNPHFHEAIGYVEEEGDDDIVVEELQSGYQLHGRLLRAAKVKVRKAP